MKYQNGKYYWDLEGVHTYLPAKFDAIKLLRTENILTWEEGKALDQTALANLIREKINKGGRYMEVPRWMTAFRI